ncbi:MAG: thioredoxin-dependent thiol peroxidase [Eubacteriales bacterium]|nr:thioredoxin-dependent thiol peroxidase [Eubacteriales bacterium]
MLKIGDSIPNNPVLDENGNEVRLTDFAGQKLIVYFYPKDNTPGCTNEALDLERVRGELTQAGWKVIGISGDSPASHGGFKLKFNLGFSLLSDPDKALIAAFGAYGEKKNYGKVYLGIIRSTFLIDEQGKVVKVYDKVKTASHGEDVLADIRAGL